MDRQQLWRAAASRQVSQRQVPSEPLIVLGHSFSGDFDSFSTGQFFDSLRNFDVWFKKREQSELNIFRRGNHFQQISRSQIYECETSGRKRCDINRCKQITRDASIVTHVTWKREFAFVTRFDAWLESLITFTLFAKRGFCVGVFYGYQINLSFRRNFYFTSFVRLKSLHRAKEDRF